MRVCIFCTLFWLAHLFILSIANGSDSEEGYKPRRWTSSGDGPYRMVVSSESETLEQEESVSLGVAQEKKKKEKAAEDGEKVTQRIILKRARKRLSSEGINPRKRRRNPSAASTTGLPQTMSYNLYNHFRPLEQDLPQDHLLPFLDFGRKLSTGSTPSGVNSIESSSTPRVAAPKVKEDDDDIFHEEMDVTVMRKAVERNTVPRGPIQMKPHIVAFFRRNSTELIPVHNKTLNDEGKGLTNDVLNKTDIKDVHYDLQSNESGIKLHAVLSPNYGLRLNKSDNATVNTKSIDGSTRNTNRTETESEPNKTAVNGNRGSNNTQVHIQVSNGTLTEQYNSTMDAQTSTTNTPVTESSEKSTTTSTSMPEDNNEQPLTNEPKTTPTEAANDTQSVELPAPSPKPTARILSTAVVTSVSVKESPRLPRIKTNLTRPDSFQRLTLKNVTAELINMTPHLNVESRYRADNHSILGLQSARRKMYTTLRPKTTTYRPVTFRSVYRRNFTGLGSGVVHVLSTPPTYIEVPKIITISPLSLLSNDSNTTVFSNTTDTIVHDTSSTLRQETAPEQTSTQFPSTTRTTTSSTTPSSRTPTTTTTPFPSTPSTTTASTPPSTTTTTAIAPTVTTTVALVTIPSSLPTTSPKPIPTTIINHHIISDSLPTDDVPQPFDSIPPEESTFHFENTTVEIEFKPLDVHIASTTQVPTNITRRPSLLWIYNQRNQTGVRTQNVGVAYTDSHIGLVTYVLAGLALIPLLLGLSVLGRQIFRKSKKKVLDESEYSSEYNRTPLPTKLPRVPAHINWEAEKATVGAPPPAPQVPVTKWEFSRDKLRLQTVLGQGNFGQVWKAEADDLCGHEGSTRLVAVKTVKEGASPREKEDLLRELGIMQELGAHPNVVTLLGCCTEKEPYFLIMEYVMYGKLLAFLREHRTRAHYFNFSDLSSALTSRDLTCFAYCVARGMEYLVSKGIIHRDLAARNILVDHTKLCKIADFGMSRNVQDTGQIYEQRPNRGALPIRWMAPESLHLSLFTHKSDVWSFGILLWEIITLGSTPYSKIGAREVMRLVKEGYRLEKPKHCRSELYKVLTKCWHSDPAKRPSFTDLKQDIAALLADEQTNGEYVDLEALTEEMCDQSS